MLSFLSVILDYSLAVGLSKGLAAIGASIVVLGPIRKRGGSWPIW